MGLIDNGGGALTPSQESTLDSLQALDAGQIPNADGQGDFEYSGATKDETSEEIGFDKAANFTQASINISKAITLSEATLDLLVRDNVKNKNLTFPQIEISDQGTEGVKVLEAGSSFVSTPQPDDSQVITTNPLLVPTFASFANETTKFVLRADQPMSNVRITLTDIASGVIVKYIPDQSAVEKQTGGLNLIAGENVIDLDNKDPSQPLLGIFNLGNTPLRSTLGEIGSILIEADNMALKGNAIGIPYVQNTLKPLFEEGVALTKDVTYISDNYTRLNTAYTSTDATTSGAVFTSKAIGTSDSVLGGQFTSAVDGVSNATVETQGLDTFAVGDIVQVSGSKLNNQYIEVLSHTGGLLAMKGLGLTDVVEAFTGRDFKTTVDNAVLTKVEVVVVRTNLAGRVEQGKGSSTPLAFTELYDQESKAVVMDAYMSFDLTYDTNLEEKVIEIDTVNESNLINLGSNGEFEVLVSGRYEGHIVLQVNERSDPTIVVWNEIKPLATGVWELSGGMAKTRFREDVSWTLTLDGGLELQAGDKVRVKAMMLGFGSDEFTLEGITQAADLGTLVQPSAHIDIVRVGALT